LRGSRAPLAAQWVMLWLLACVVPHPPTDSAIGPGTFDDSGMDSGVAGEGGQSGTELPTGCRVVSTTAVADPTVPEGGARSSLDEVLTAMAGTWTGTLTLPGDGNLGATLVLGSMALDPVVVSYEVEDPNLQAPTVSCEPEYVFGLDADLAAADQLQVIGTASMAAGGSRPAGLWWRNPLSSVEGALEPSFDPTRYDSTELVVVLGLDDTGWTGTAQWIGTPNAADDASEVEPVGSFVLTR
jgi:hypothetical protein